METPQALALAALASLETASANVFSAFYAVKKTQTPDEQKKAVKKWKAEIAAYVVAEKKATDALDALDLHDVALAVATCEHDDLAAAIAAARATVAAR